MRAWNSRNLFVLGIVLLVVSLAGSTQRWVIATYLVSLTAIIVAILLRPREVKAEKLLALRSHGADWQGGVGPAPGETGPILHGAEMPPVLIRKYTASRQWEATARQQADAAAAAERGYQPVSESTVPGSWRGVDWLGAAVLLLFGFVLGLAALIFLATTKPGATTTVVYKRTGTAEAASGDQTSADPAARLATLDALRSKGLITDDEWTARRGQVIGEL